MVFASLVEAAEFAALRDAAVLRAVASDHQVRRGLHRLLGLARSAGYTPRSVAGISFAAQPVAVTAADSNGMQHHSGHGDAASSQDKGPYRRRRRQKSDARRQKD